MRKTCGWLIVILSVWAAACSRSGDTDKIAALDKMFKAGLLTKTEYEARKSALQHTAEALVALDNAVRAGVLTKDEYQAKKAALIASSSTTAPADAPPVAEPAPPTPTPASPDPPVSAATPAPPEPETATVAAAPVPQSSPAAVPAVQPSGGVHNGYLVMKKATVMDQNGFERPIPSASMLIPADWQYQGATQWMTKDLCNGIQTTFRASGPDGRAFEIFPNYNWTWADDPTFLRQDFQQKAQMGTKGCDVIPPMGAADFLRRNLPRLRPNAQVVDIEPMPKYLQTMQQQARQTEQMAMRYNLQQRVRPDVARARLRYSVGGKAVEEWVVATTLITGTLGQSYDVRSGRMGQSFSYSCAATLSAARAPQGELDSSEKFFELIISTIRVDPNWQARLNQHAGAMSAIEQKGVSDRAAINRQTATDLSNIRRQGWENQQKSEDHVFGQFSDTTRGVENYRNPATGETFQLSNQYGHAWVNNHNEYILSDQAGWDPNTVLKTGNWTALEHVKR